MANPLDTEVLSSKDWHDSKRFKAMALAIGAIILVYILGVVAQSTLPNLKDTISQSVKDVVGYIMYLVGIYIGGESLTSVFRNHALGKVLSAPQLPESLPATLGKTSPRVDRALSQATTFLREYTPSPENSGNPQISIIEENDEDNEDPTLPDDLARKSILGSDVLDTHPTPGVYSR